MYEDELISIIVPIYNIEEYISKCIDSLIRQTYTNIEILLIDDGSTDQSGVIADEYAKIDSRIIVYHKENGGLSDARNFGIDRAKGQYIAFVDGDDFIYPQMYEILKKYLCKENADISLCEYDSGPDGDKNKIVETSELVCRVVTGKEILTTYSVIYVVAWNKLYRTDIFSDVRYPKGRFHEDEFVAHRLLFKCKKIVFIKESFYFYRKRSQSIMSKISMKRIVDGVEAWQDRLSFFENKKIDYIISRLLDSYLSHIVNTYFYCLKMEQINDKRIFKYLVNTERSALRQYKGRVVALKYKLFCIHPDLYRIWNKINHIHIS